MSANGPNRRYAPLRGTQNDVLRFLRRGSWVGSVEALAGVVGRPERNVWMALATLSARGLVRAKQSPHSGLVVARVTPAGLAIRL